MIRKTEVEPAKAAYTEAFKRYHKTFDNAKNMEEYKRISGEFRAEATRMKTDNAAVFNALYLQYAAVVQAKFAALSRITGDESLAIKI